MKYCITMNISYYYGRMQIMFSLSFIGLSSKFYLFYFTKDGLPILNLQPTESTKVGKLMVKN